MRDSDLLEQTVLMQNILIVSYFVATRCHYFLQIRYSPSGVVQEFKIFQISYMYKYVRVRMEENIIVNHTDN